MLQLREEQETPNNGEAGRLITDHVLRLARLDGEDRPAIRTTTPARPPDGSLFVADDDTVPSQTVTDYDGQGRPVASVFYSLGQYQWQTTTAYPGADETDVTPPPGGTATSDVHQRAGPDDRELGLRRLRHPDRQRRRRPRHQLHLHPGRPDRLRHRQRGQHLTLHLQPARPAGIADRPRLGRDQLRLRRGR